MVPIPESAYFPPLERCLEGEKILISWRTVFIAVSQGNDLLRVHPAIEGFLSEPFVLQLLGHPYNPFSFTTTQSKSSFETKTAAINVTPTTEREYDIAEIKEDALWLSKEAQIDEISALRIVTLEYQTRSSSQLRYNFSNEEVAALQETTENSTTDFSNLLPRTNVSGTIPGQENGSFDSQQSRRLRALRLCLSERRYLLRCAGTFLQAALDQRNEIADAPDQGNGTDKGKGKETEEPWIYRIGSKLSASLEQAGRGVHECLMESIRSLRATLKALEAGSGWLKAEDGAEDLELDWLSNKVIEAIHIMEISFRIIAQQQRIPSSEAVLEWFKFASTYGFFDQFELPFPVMSSLVPSLQSLVAVISLSLLDPQRSIESFYEPQDSVRSIQDGQSLTPYLVDLQTMSDIHKIMIDAASAASALASPAILAWSIILKTMRDTSLAKKEARELRQSVRAEQALEDDVTFDDDTASVSRSGRPRQGRRPSAGSDSSAETGMYDDFLESIKDTTPDEDTILFLGSCAIDGSHVFDVLTSLAVFFGAPAYSDSFGTKARLAILALTRCSIEILDYSPEVVSTTLAVLGGDQSFWNLSHSQLISTVNDPVATFLSDDYFAQKLVDTAMARYPYERLPFLRIMRAIATCRTVHDDGVPFAVRILEKIPSFTFQLAQNFKNYETIQEEDNANTIQLTEDFRLFQPRSVMKLVHGQSGVYEKSSDSSEIPTEFYIPVGTPGRIISDSDSGPRVAIWFQENSGLRYIGKLLETALTAGEYVDATTGEGIDHESIAEMISLLATLLLTSTKIGEAAEFDGAPHENAYSILENASDGLDRNRDIVTVIFKLFEEELQRQSSGLDNTSSLDVLVASIQFIYALVPILPGRVWPLLGRSELLEIDGRGGMLSDIIGRVEIITCRYDFLLSCINLFHALVEDSVSHALLRKVGSNSLVRIGTTEDQGTGVPDQILSKVLFSFTRTLVGVFESFGSWRFVIEEQRLTASELISRAFNNILYYTHGVDDGFGSDSKLTSSLMSAADFIIETFLSTTSGHLRFRPLLRSFLDGFSAPEPSLQANRTPCWINEVKSALLFTTTLIKLSALLDRQTSQLEHQLFQIAPLIARLYAVDVTYRLAVIKLLEALVLSASSRDGEPPSLLGHLGRQTSKSFISMLLDLDKPLDGDLNVVAIWHFASVIVSSRQQWFSVYLLTGRPPRDTLKQDSQGKNLRTARTLLKTALQCLLNIKSLAMPRSMAMLEFISLAQNFWPWAMSDIHQKESNFIKSVSSFVANLQPVSLSASPDRLIEASYQYRMAAYIADIVAMYLYHSRQVGNKHSAIDLLPDLEFYTKHAVSVPNYNSSLHGNMKRNFEARFSGCKLQHFKRTRLEAQEFGREYFFDIRFANKMLRSDPAWVGRKNDGLVQELEKASINLSLVDAQVALLHGWKLLAVEISITLTDRQDLQVNLSKIVKDCLVSNNRSQLPDSIFARVTQTRVDLALIILQRLVESDCSKPEVLGLLPIIWETIRTLDTSFGTTPSGSDADYYRSLLKMLFLALRAHGGNDRNPLGTIGVPNAPSTETAQKIQATSATIRIVLDVLGQVVAKGFHDLVGAIHEQPTESVADDISLVTAILQACLLVPGIEFSHNQILEAMVASDVARVATTLFSWSDKLAIDGDPIYGELSTLFLLELSSIPVMAEQLAIQGILGHISNASITTYIRRANVSSLAEGVGLQRCFSIWARGILPLLLNILDAVGVAIAAEIAIFLNQFPKLLEQSIEAIDVPHSRLGTKVSIPRITLVAVSEVHSLALLVFILSSFRSSLAGITEIPDVKWDATIVLDSVEHWLTERTVLRERILPLGMKEMEMAKKKPLASSTGCENRLEEKVVQELLGVRDVLMSGEA